MQKGKIAFLVLVVAALLVMATSVAAAPDVPKVYQAQLGGGEEVPPVDTGAHGIAMFRLSADGTALEYKLVVNNLEDTLMAHIHIAPAGENGPVAVWLYPEGPPPQLIEGRFSGMLAQGTITADDVVLEGQTFESVLEAMQTGNAYVNVHTSAHPGGEIRGQVEALGQ